MLAPQTADTRVCATCGVDLGGSSYVTAILTMEDFCVGCSPLAHHSPRKFVRCKAEQAMAGYVLAYRDGPKRWQGIVITDVKTRVLHVAGLVMLRVRIFLATGQVFELAPGDLIPLLPHAKPEHQ